MKSKARIALFIGILLISTYPILVKILGEASVVSAFYRMFVCVICLLPILFIKEFKSPKGIPFLLNLLCGILFGMDVYFWNLAIEGSSVTQATLLTNLAPIFVGIISFLFLPTKPKFNFWIGAIVAMIGMLIFVGIDIFINLSFDIPFLLGILSAIIYSIYIVLSKHVLEKAQVLPFMLINNISASIVLGIINYKTNQPFIGFSTNEWFLLISGGVFCQLLAWFLISYATKYMRATRVSLSLLSQTVFASILANIIIGETIKAQSILGGLIILLGISITFIEKKFFS